MIYWFSFWACNLKRSRWITFLCFLYYYFFFYLYNCRAVSTEVIQLCSKIFISLWVSRYEELYQLEVGDRINSISCWEGGEAAALWRGVHWQLNAAAVTLSTECLWDQGLRRVGSHQVCGWYLNIFTTQICLIPISSFGHHSFYYSEIHVSLKARFPKCVQGNDTFQRGSSGQINLRHNILDTPLLEIQTLCFGLNCVSPKKRYVGVLTPSSSECDFICR